MTSSALKEQRFILAESQSAYQAAYRCRNICINGLMNDLLSWRHILQTGEPNSYPSSHLHNRRAIFSSEEHLRFCVEFNDGFG